MAVVMTMQVPGGTGVYDQINEEMGVANNLPDGLIHHFAAAKGDDVLIWDVWESRDAFERFNNERLMPAVQKVAGDQMSPGSAAEPTFAELHNEFHK